MSFRGEAPCARGIESHVCRTNLLICHISHKPNQLERLSSSASGATATDGATKAEPANRCTLQQSKRVGLSTSAACAHATASANAAD